MHTSARSVEVNYFGRTQTEHLAAAWRASVAGASEAVLACKLLVVIEFFLRRAMKHTEQGAVVSAACLGVEALQALSKSYGIVAAPTRNETQAVQEDHNGDLGKHIQI
jgi:hypothetical protein